MNSPAIRVRRATVDDLATLKSLWAGMNIPLGDLERRLTEFQVAVLPDGKVFGAVGFQIVQRHGRIHSEAFSDFSLADQARPQFWTRIQSLAMNHGLVRLWTQENAPFWSHNGLQAADSETLTRLPDAWDRLATGWLTLRLKDEEMMASLDKEFDMFVASEKARSGEALDQARKLKAVVIVIVSILVVVLFFWWLWIFLQRRTGGSTPL